jgi:hypothetical protein
LSRSLAISRLVGIVVAGAFVLGAAEAGDVSGVVSQGSIGFVTGQSIRVSISSVAAEGASAPLPLVVTVHFFDATGDEIAVSPVMTVGPGHTRTYIVRRSSLPLPGEPGTGRLQVRTETHMQVLSQPLGQSQVVHTVGELVEDATGKNSGLIGDTRTVISAQAALH